MFFCLLHTNENDFFFACTFFIWLFVFACCKANEEVPSVKELQRHTMETVVRSPYEKREKMSKEQVAERRREQNRKSAQRMRVKHKAYETVSNELLFLFSLFFCFFFLTVFITFSNIFFLDSSLELQHKKKHTHLK